MAEQNIQDVLEGFTDEIVQEDQQIQMDYAQVRQSVETYNRKEHTAEEDKEFQAKLDDAIGYIGKTISDMKNIESELKTAEITVLKKHLDFDNDSVILRGESKRSKEKDDSGYFSKTVSVDSRLFTENNYLVVNPTETSEETSEEPTQSGTQLLKPCEKRLKEDAYVDLTETLNCYKK